MRVTRLVVSNFRGIEERDIAVAPAGFVAKGRCGSGKSSILFALRAALCAQGATPDAIRMGEDKAEIRVDIDDLSVRRIITRNGPSKLTVEKGGMKASKPAAYLSEMLGSSPLDPIEFFLGKPPQRKAQILAALPITVTRAQLATYAADLPTDFDVSGHGLDVVERARKFFYEERTLANKETSEAKATAERLSGEAQKLSAAVSPGPIVPSDEARTALVSAERSLVALEEQTRAAGEAGKKSEAQRARIAQLRQDAETALAGIAPVHPTAPFEAELVECDKLVAQLEEKLGRGRALRQEISAKIATATAANALRERALFTANERRTTADELANALDATTAVAPTADVIAAAQQKINVANASLDRATSQALALIAVGAAEAGAASFRALEAEAADLDETVKRLTKDAPADLLRTCEGIPGLALEGDEVKLDGKSLDMLCGAEQMRFAVELARRANEKIKILVVDGLERLDPELMDVFVAEATRDGWQLLATRVDRGDVVIEALARDDEAKAAD